MLLLMTVSPLVLCFPPKLRHPSPHSHPKCSFHLGPFLCSFVLSPIPAAQLPQLFTRQDQTRAVTVSLRWETSQTARRDIHHSEWLIQQSSVELDKDQAANYASSFVMPAAKYLNSKQLTLLSIVGDVKHCLRDVAWGGKGAAAVVLSQSLSVCSHTLITSYRTLHTSAVARDVWQGSPCSVKVTGHLQTDFK